MTSVASFDGPVAAGSHAGMTGPSCSFHPDTPARGTCGVCLRPVCAACTVFDSGEDRCPDCVHSGRRTRRAVWLGGLAAAVVLVGFGATHLEPVREHWSTPAGPVPSRSRASVDEVLAQLRQASESKTCDARALTVSATAALGTGHAADVLDATERYMRACGPSARVGALRYTAHQQVGDVAAALEDASALVDGAPLTPTYRLWKARTNEQLKHWLEAAADYQRALELDPSLSSQLGAHLPQVLAKADRPCDAVRVIDSVVAHSPSLEPALREDRERFSTTGHCEPASSGTATVRGAPGARGFLSRASVNGVEGNFLIDTGAAFVSVSQSFAQRIGLKLKAGKSITLITAAGPRHATLVTVPSVRLQGLEAHSVEVAVADDDAMGKQWDGLLGNSFLSRFQVHLDGAHNVLRLSSGATAKPAVNVAPTPAPASGSVTAPVGKSG